jgi:glycosyltransferase involved in cell wall biosynthesis
MAMRQVTDRQEASRVEILGVPAVTYLIARLRRKPFILWTGIWISLQTPFHRLAVSLTLWIYRHADAIVVGRLDEEKGVDYLIQAFAQLKQDDVVLNQTTEDWHTGCVTLSGAKGLVFRRDASPTAQHDSRPWSSQVYQCRMVRFGSGG